MMFRMWPKGLFVLDVVESCAFDVLLCHVLLFDVFATSDVTALWYLTGSGDLLFICGVICMGDMRFDVFEISGISFSSLTT